MSRSALTVLYPVVLSAATLGLGAGLYTAGVPATGTLLFGTGLLVLGGGLSALPRGRRSVSADREVTAG